DAVDADRLGRADQRSEVLLILELIEEQEQRRLVPALGDDEDVVEVGVLVVEHLGRDVLVPVGVGDAVERAAVEDLDRYVGAAGEVGDLTQWGAGGGPGAQVDAADGAARAERFVDDVAAPDHWHGRGLDPVTPSSTLCPRAGPR